MSMPSSEASAQEAKGNSSICIMPLPLELERQDTSFDIIRSPQVLAAPRLSMLDDSSMASIVPPPILDISPSISSVSSSKTTTAAAPPSWWSPSRRATIRSSKDLLSLKDAAEDVQRHMQL